MKKIVEFIKQHKEIIITVVLLMALFFIVGSILNNNYSIERESYKKQLEQNNIEKQRLLKENQILRDSANYWEVIANQAILKDTIYLQNIIKEKQKTNEKIHSISTLNSDSLYQLYTKLTEEYISTKFE